MKRPACLIGSLTLALLLIETVLPQGVFWLPAAFSILVGGLLWAFRHPTVGLCWGLAAVCSVLVCLTAPNGPAWLQPNQQVQMQAVVQQTGDNTLLLVEKLDGSPARFRVAARGLPKAEPGTRLTGRFTFRPLDQATRLRQQANGVYWQVNASGPVQTMGVCPPSVWQRLRASLGHSLRRELDPKTGGVLTAMLLGQREAIPRPLYRAYQAAGIPHVLVVSGLHLAVLCSCLYRDLSTRKGCLCYSAACILLVMGYVPLAGAGPSLLRAGAAVVYYSIGIALGLPADPFTTLAVSGVLLSIGRPALVWSLSFQLSVCATAGVLLGAAWARQWQPPPGTKWTRPIWGALRQQLAISLMAALFVLPVQALWGLPVSLLGVASNLAVFLLLRPMLLCGLAAAVCGGVPLLEPVYHGACLAAGSLARLLNGIVETMARVPGAQFVPNKLWVGGASILFIVCLVLRMHWDRAEPQRPATN